MVVASSERRADQRLPLSLTAHCQVGTDYSRSDVVDVSRSGIGLRTDTPWPPGTSLRVAMALPHHEGPKFCTLTGTVVRARPGGVGVRLDDSKASRSDRDVLAGFLAVLSMQRQLSY
ncbi:MAG: PilZ domain-containing protein [Deltaproteobacteria bacterium]|nr:PilZ domain-containing protein [Deltaproteobacteria bacterium]